MDTSDLIKEYISLQNGHHFKKYGGGGGAVRSVRICIIVISGHFLDLSDQKSKIFSTLLRSGGCDL